MNIFQISDLHYPYQGETGIRKIEKILNHMKNQEIKPDVLLVSGDLINRDYDDYRPVFECLGQLKTPYLCITGNHDKSASLMSALKKYVPAHPQSEHLDKLDYSVDSYPLQIIALDSYKENTPGGEVTQEQLDWLEKKLSANPQKKPVIIMVHQFTVDAGLDFFDVKTRQPWCDKFNEIVSAHKETVKLVACGHLHNSLVSNIAGVPVISCFSANWQAHLDFEPVDNMQELERPVGYYIHRWNGKNLISYAVALS